MKLFGYLFKQSVCYEKSDDVFSKFPHVYVIILSNSPLNLKFWKFIAYHDSGWYQVKYV